MTAQIFGGLVSQIDLRKITADLIKVLETELLKHGLLVIPDQHLSAQELIHFARCLGSVEGDDGSNTSAARSITNRDESGSLLTETGYLSCLALYKKCDSTKILHASSRQTPRYRRTYRVC